MTAEYGGTAAPTSLPYKKKEAGTEEVWQKGLQRQEETVGSGGEQGVRELLWECSLWLEGDRHAPP